MYCDPLAIETITFEIDAYERLKSAKRFPRESFSEVVRRLPLQSAAMTAREFLAMSRRRSFQLTEANCQLIDELNASDLSPSIP
ncbi:MAG: antitoxin VapB family protein [bacterium]